MAFFDLNTWLEREHSYFKPGENKLLNKLARGPLAVRHELWLITQIKRIFLGVLELKGEAKRSPEEFDTVDYCFLY